MGVSLAEINAGVLETSKVLNETMSLWNQITGKSVATPTIQAPAAATPAGGSTGSQAAGATSTQAAATPTWVWIAAAGAALLLLMRR
jgi:hypothetical protein